jgi:hypothetical protein
LVDIYNQATKMQTFTVVESNKPNDVKIEFQANETVTVEYYENGATSPTRSKQLKIKASATQIAPNDSIH